MLYDAHKAIMHKRSAMYMFPICFGVMVTATIFVLLFIYTTFDVNISYLVVYTLFGFLQIFMSMKREYDEICSDESNAYSVIELLHSLSPELITDYEAYCKVYVPRYDHIIVSKSLLEKYKK